MYVSRVAAVPAAALNCACSVEERYSAACTTPLTVVEDIVPVPLSTLYTVMSSTSPAFHSLPSVQVKWNIV